MNIHEHQAKEILKKFGILIPKGVVVFNLDEISFVPYIILIIILESSH